MGFMHVVSSNQMEALILSLKKKLFQPNKHPLLRKIVVVQNAFVKRQIQLFFFKHFGLKIVTGVKFIEINEAVVYLNKVFFKKELHFPSKSLLALEIKQMLEDRLDKVSFSRVKEYHIRKQKKAGFSSCKTSFRISKNRKICRR